MKLTVACGARSLSASVRHPRLLDASGSGQEARGPVRTMAVRIRPGSAGGPARTQRSGQGAGRTGGEIGTASTAQFSREPRFTMRAAGVSCHITQRGESTAKLPPLAMRIRCGPSLALFARPRQKYKRRASWPMRGVREAVNSPKRALVWAPVVGSNRVEASSPLNCVWLKKL